MDTKRFFKKTVVFSVITSFLFWNFAMAAPEGGQVVAGSAAISNSTNTTTINQSSSSAVINWNSFNTNSNEAVNFIQPSSSAVALNRITSGTPTTFAGQLNANGQVWILNPAGVLFTSTSRIDVGGLVATTLDISNSNFMNKNYVLSQSPNYSQSYVINNGQITASQNGLVALVAPTVENNGIITANMGNVLLASGTVATLDPYGDNLIQFAANQYASEGSVTNTGTITANGGKVVMAANSVNKIIKDVVNNGGFIEANNAVQSSNGVIVLGGNSGITNIAGKIYSNRIVVKGHDTVISGELKTQDGGFIETSGETISISPAAVINAGQGGLWYLDPLTIDIAASYGNIIQNQLQAGTNVTLSTGVSGATGGTGNIYADQPITWSTNASLILMAYNDIIVSQPIITSGASSNITLHADAGAVGGTVVFSGAGVINTNGSATIYYHPVYPPFSGPTPTDFSPFFSANQPTTFMTINDLNNLAVLGAVNQNNNFLLNADIFVPGGSIPEGVFDNFNGIFDGHNYVTGTDHIISGLTVSSSNPLINNYMGGIALVNNGTIENLFVSGTVSVTSGPFPIAIGGIAGLNNGVIADVSFTGTIHSTDGAMSNGGIAGINTGVIVGSNSSGTINAAGIEGGIAGQASGIIWNDYSAVQITNGIGSVGGIVGKVPNNTNLNLNLVYFNGFATNIDAFVGSLGTGASLTLTNPGVPLGGANYVVNFTNCPTCIGTSTTSHGASYKNFTTAQMSNQSIWNQNTGFDFVNTWTTNGDTTAPTIIRTSTSNNTVLGSGSLSIPAAQTVSIYGANSFITNVTSNGTTGDFIFIYNPDSVAAPFYLATTNGATDQGTILQTVSNSVPVTGLNITSGLVEVNGASGFSNANLAVAAATTPATTPYTASGNNLTLNPDISFLTTVITPYNLNGNITTSGAGNITFDNTVALTASSVLTSSGTIDFASTINGAFNLTASGNNVIFGGNVGNATPLTSLTVVSNSPIIPAGFIKVTGASSFNANSNAISLLNLGNSFVGPVTLLNSGANDANIYDSVNLILAASTIGGNLNATTGGSNITLNGDINSGGTQTYNNPVILSASDILTSTSGNINFTSTLDGGFNLTANAPAGSVLFGDNVGGTTPLASLTINSNGSIVPAGFVKVTGASSFNTGAAPITLSNASNNLAGIITLNNSGLGNDVVVVNSVPTTLAASTIGGALTVTSGGNITLNGNITSGGTQTYNNPVVLGASDILSSATGNIDFTSTVNGGGFDLTTNTTADPSSTIFNANATNVNNLTISGDSTFNNAVSMTVTGNAVFNDEFNGPGSLVLTAANIAISENDSSGIEPGEVPLSALTVNGPVVFTGGFVDANAQTYNNLVTLAASANPTLLNGTGLIHFVNNIEGPGSLTIVSANTQFDGSVGGTIPLDVLDITSQLTITGFSNIDAATQNYRGNVIIAGAGAVLSSSNVINIFGTVEGPGSLAVFGNLDVLGSMGASIPLDSLVVTGNTETSGSVFTVNDQDYQGIFTATGNPALTSSAGDILFGSIVNGSGVLFTSTTTGHTTQFDNNVFAGGLNITGTTTINGANLIRTARGQFYSDSVFLNNDLNVLNTGFGVINFAGGGVMGPSRNLSVQNFSGMISNGILGGVDVLSLTMGGTGGSNLFNSIVNGVPGDATLSVTQFYLGAVGIYCVNGVCAYLNTDIPPKQDFMIPDGLNNCGFLGCDNLIIDKHLLELGDVAVSDGSVVAVDQYGSIRLLQNGDTVFVGETVYTGPDSHICILIPNGTKLCLGPERKYKVL